MILPSYAGLRRQAPIVDVYQSDYRNGGTGTDITFNDWDIGPAQSDRVVYFVYAGQNNPPTGIVVNGVSLTLVRSHLYGSISIAMFAGVVPNGEIVSLTIQGTVADSLCTSYVAYGGFSTTAYAQGSNNNLNTITVDVPTDGLVLAAGVSTATGTDIAWTAGVTEDLGEYTSGGERSSVASAKWLPAETARTVTMTNGGGFRSLMAVSFAGVPAP